MIIELLSMVFGLALLILKNRDSKAERTYENDLKELDRAIRNGSADDIGALFEGLRRKSGGYSGGQGGNPPV